ncbi:MAG: AAA family ATPase [Alphaproteobacteria bacterium]|nr:AAA family ATPase [Alphaproteobacteria bacterium]
MARPRRSSLPPPYLTRLQVDHERLEGRQGYPFDLPMVRDLDLRFDRPVTVIVGDNGSGKSTLLEAIAALAGFGEAGGSRSHHFAGSAPDRRLLDEVGDDGRADALRAVRTEQRLTDVLRAGWLPKVTDGLFFRAETFWDLARYLDEAAVLGGGRAPLHLRRSHGEGFLDFFEDRFDRVIRAGRASLFVFDEPESALAPARQLDFLRLLRHVEEGARAQVVLATHSPVLMAYPGASLWRIARGRVVPVELEDVEQFQVLRDFFHDPHGFVEGALS